MKQPATTLWHQRSPDGVARIPPLRLTLLRQMAAAHLSRKQYVPGQSAPESGVYRVHHRDHRHPHDVVVVGGDTFPGCRACMGDVRYTLAQPATYVVHDFDLAAPAELLPYRRSKSA